MQYQHKIVRTVTLMVTTPGTALAIPAGVRTRRWPRAEQCAATTRDAGERCRRRALRGGRVCFVHGGQLPSVRAAAEAEVNEIRARALSIADRALDVVEEALEHSDPQVRLKAARELLDRTLPRLTPGTAVQVNIGTAGPDGAPALNPADVIRQRLAALHAEKAAPSVVGPTFAETLAQDGKVVDAELVHGDWTG